MSQSYNKGEGLRCGWSWQQGSLFFLDLFPSYNNSFNSTVPTSLRLNLVQNIQGISPEAEIHEWRGHPSQPFALPKTIRHGLNVISEVSVYS